MQLYTPIEMEKYIKNTDRVYVPLGIFSIKITKKEAIRTMRLMASVESSIRVMADVSKYRVLIDSYDYEINFGDSND